MQKLALWNMARALLFLQCNLSIDPVTVYSLAGKGNSFANLLIENQNSTRVFLVNESAKIYNCVPVDKIKIERDENVNLE